MTIVISKSQGAGLVANATDVHLKFERNGEVDKQLVLHGIYLEIKRVQWIDENSATICLTGGYTSAFSNRVTVNLVGQRLDHHVHFFLREDCN